MKTYRALLALLIAMLAGALLVHWLAADPGYVLVRYAGYDLSTTLVAAVLLLAGALAIAAGVLYLLWLPLRLWLGWRRRRMRRRLSEAQTALFLGQPERALRLLAKVRGQSTEPVASLATADAERALGHDAAARTRLAQLDARAHGAVRALALAEHAAGSGDAVAALALLDDRALVPPPPRALWLRARLLATQADFDAALALMPALRKANAAAPADLDAMHAAWAARALATAADVTTLARRWDTLLPALHRVPAVLLAWAERADALRWPAGAAGQLAEALQRQHDPDLLRAFGRIAANDASTRAAHRAQVEHWLQRHPDDAAGLLALARLTHADGQPAAAEALLHRVLARRHDAEAWELLGDWRAAQGDDATARRCYANALAAQRGDDAEPLPGRDLRARIAAAAAIVERDELGTPRLPGGD
jgi:HemY protein